MGRAQIMLRDNRMTHLTVFYPNSGSPFLVLTADFFQGFTDYSLFDYNKGKYVMRFRILADGHKIDTTIEFP